MLNPRVEWTNGNHAFFTFFAVKLVWPLAWCDFALDLASYQLGLLAMLLCLVIFGVCSMP